MNKSLSWKQNTERKRKERKCKIKKKLKISGGISKRFLAFPRLHCSRFSFFSFNPQSLVVSLFYPPTPLHLLPSPLLPATEASAFNLNSSQTLKNQTKSNRWNGNGGWGEGGTGETPSNSKKEAKSLWQMKWALINPPLFSSFIYYFFNNREKGLHLWHPLK